jgi:DNA-binding GntR family transcriptional regulator
MDMHGVMALQQLPRLGGRAPQMMVRARRAKKALRPPFLVITLLTINDRQTIMSAEVSNPPRPSPTSFQVGRVSKHTFRQHIAESLRAAILGGQIAPGTPLVETALAAQFDVSRGPLREAMRQLIEEGLLVTVPYTGTHVISLSVTDVREIYSMRVTLERFACEQAWDKRDAAFRHELQRRNDVLTACIDAGDDNGSILAELDFHGLIYETSGHRLLQQTWHSLRGRLQLYWAAHHRANAMRGPKRDAHDSYMRAALGNDLPAMLAEIGDHMKRGATQTERFLSPPTPPLKEQPT